MSGRKRKDNHKKSEQNPDFAEQNIEKSEKKTEETVDLKSEKQGGNSKRTNDRNLAV